jgi:hypothetical protein
MSTSTLWLALPHAELDYRRERLAADVASSRRFVAWVGRRFGGTRTASDELTLAA